MSPELLKAGEVARRLGRHLDTLNRWIERGIFPPHDCRIDRRRYWRSASVDRWFREQARPPAAPISLQDTEGSTPCSMT